MAAKDIYELSISRLIKAPPAKVYSTWFDHLGEWWAPAPYTTPVVELEKMVGGRFYTEMLSPQGERMRGEGVFLELIEDRKIVFTNAFQAGWIPQEPFMVALFTFEPAEDGTVYTASARHWNEAAMKNHDSMGFHGGWTAAAGQLAALAEKENELSLGEGV